MMLVTRNFGIMFIKMSPCASFSTSNWCNLILAWAFAVSSSFGVREMMGI